MENEDFLSNIWIVVIAVISIILRVVGSKAKSNQEQNAPDMQETYDDEEHEMETHPGSLETIFDEILEEHRATKVESPTVRVEETKPQTISNLQNATNRTFARESAIATETPSIDNNQPKKKFNLREAVIYSEVLTPKFKDAE